jgi:pyranose oxidase
LQLSFLQNGQNPFQRGWDNLPAAAATRVVGGMGSHWTCCTPRQHRLERSTLFSDTEWDALYPEVERLFGTNSTSFDDSIRQQLVKHVLQDAYSGRSREIRSMPLACKRGEKNKDYVEWSCTATILGALSEPGSSGNLEVRANTQCVKLQLDSQTGQVAWAVVKDLLGDESYYIMANKYVICAGAVLTPGILANSGFDKGSLPALVCQGNSEDFHLADYSNANRVAT